MGLILIRYSGEIGIKGKTRYYFVRRLRRNLRDALRHHGIEGTVWSEGQRVYAEVMNGARDSALSAFSRVFGVASVSPIERVPSDLSAIRAEALALAERLDLDPLRSFRVQTRRADKSFPHISPKVNRLVGGAIHHAHHARVDLSDEADVTIGIEIRSESTRSAPRVAGTCVCASLWWHRLARGSLADDAPRLRHHPHPFCAE